LRDLSALFKAYDYDSALYGHFGDGCIHCRINFGLRTQDGVRKWLRFLDQAADLVVSYGGSISGEHGDGQSKAELLVKMYGPELIEAFREFKAIWDPAGMMNPGKVVDPYPITSNLRLGPDYHPPKLQTHFDYPGRQAQFRPCGDPLCRRGRVPAAQQPRWRDVSELHGHARREAFDPRACAPVVRNAAWRCDRAELA